MLPFAAVRVDAREGEGDNIVLGDKYLVPSDTFWARMVMHPDRELCIISNRDGIAALGLSEKDCPAAGIVYFRQGRTHIMLGRSTRSKDVKWAGDPDTPKLRIGGVLNPRSSFKTFIEKSRTESRAWSTEDINVISVLRDRICEHAHTCMLALLRGDVKLSNERYLTAMERARDNFEFFAHMSHEVRGWALESTIALDHRSNAFFVNLASHSVSVSLTTSPDFNPHHKISYLTRSLSKMQLPQRCHGMPRHSSRVGWKN